MLFQKILFWANMLIFATAFLYFCFGLYMKRQMMLYDQGVVSARKFIDRVCDEADVTYMTFYRYVQGTLILASLVVCFYVTVFLLAGLGKQ